MSRSDDVARTGAFAKQPDERNGAYRVFATDGYSHTSDSANVLVMQSGPLAALIGERGGPAVGYLVLAAP